MSDEAAEKKSCTVTQAMNIAKRGLEQIRLCVVGEISEFSDKPGYKAIYFTIRDDECAMPCLMWRNVYTASGLQLRAGMLIQVTGCFSCYPAKGRMQFSVTKIEVAGEGRLRMQVAQLAQKLNAEGLMDPARKRRPPALPQRIAVITSPRGKAIRDVMRTLRRRYPLGELMVFGVPVEGDSAPQHMCQALAAAQVVNPAPDVILLVRGGGSYEDLMPFNDEGLARAVSACAIPVVTGIGHEPDNSIADMVADMRCSTPTAAAEAIALSIEELYGKVGNATRALNAAYAKSVDDLSHQLDRLAERPLWTDENFLLGDYAQNLDLAQERLARALPNALREDSLRLDSLEQRLKTAIPDGLARQEMDLTHARERLLRAMPAILERHQRKLETTQQSVLRAGVSLAAPFQAQIALGAARLDALSPLKTLSRGYSITYAGDGPGIIKSVAGVNAGDRVTVRVEDGSLSCTVNDIKASF